MFKQIFLIIALSVGIVLSISYAQQAVQFLLLGQHWVSDLLTEVFSGGQVGNILRGLIALLAIPVVVALAPTLLYWAVRRSWFPYFMEIVWVVWLIQAGALIVTYQPLVAAA